MVSIIVPIYKVEKYLTKCVDSLLAQTYRDLEIILVDDGSPDLCGAICDRYAAQDGRVKVIHQKNAGVSTARNSGLEIAKGEYIGFCDPDDFCKADMYSELVLQMERHGADIVACGYNYYDEQYNVDESRIYRQKPVELLNRQAIYSMLSDMPPTIRHGVVTKLFRRSVIGNLRFDTSLHSAEDADFLLNYLAKVTSGAFVHRPLYCNLVRQGSATHGALDAAKIEASFAVHNRMCNR